MELRHLRYFVAVAEEGHVTRAAERLGIQQPPLSQQIRALETELGVVLFQRGARGMALTAAGETFLHEARGVLAAAAQGVARARLAAQGQYGRFSIGITTSATLHPLVPQILGGYWRTHPDVLLQIHEANASDVTDAIAAGGLDAAFLRAPVSTPLGLVFEELGTEALVVARPARPGALPTARRVALGELRAERFILVRRPAAPGLYATIVEACRAADFEPMVVAEVGRMLTAISLVAAGMGIALLPASMSAIRISGVRYSALTEPTLQAPLTLVHRADEERPVILDFVQTAREASQRDRVA